LVVAERFIQYDLGQQQRGAIVEVTLRGSGANVLLLDSSNLSTFKAGRGGYRYTGGLVTRSPYRMAIPHSGHWYVVVTMTGLRGTTNASVRIVPGPLPPAPPMRSQSSALASIRQAADSYSESPEEEAPPPEDKPYDVFVCHASEDKDEIVRPLAHALRDQNLAVWYDEFELKIGDNLRRKIDTGLIRSRFGVVVLSPAFFAHGWRQYELDGLVTKEVSGGEQVILPVWHNVTQADVMGYSPTLAGKLARSTSERSVEEIAAEITEVARR
jgi:Domain of unknown function (DUF1883)/TIR domain